MGFDVREYVKKKKENNTGDRKGFSVIDYIQNKREDNSVSGFNVADYSSYKRATELNSSSLGIINDYNEKVKNGKYLSADDLASYQKATNDFISSTDILRGIGKKYGSNYTEEEDKNWGQSKVDIGSDFTNLSKFYSNWKTEDDYNKYLKAQKEREEKLNFDLEAGKIDLDKVKEKRDSALIVENARLEWEEYEKQLLNCRTVEGVKKYKALRDEAKAKYHKLAEEHTQLYGNEDWVKIYNDKDSYYNEVSLLQTSNKIESGEMDYATAMAGVEESNKKWKEIGNRIKAIKNAINSGRLTGEQKAKLKEELYTLQAQQEVYISDERLAQMRSTYAHAEYVGKGNAMSNDYAEWDKIEGNDIDIDYWNTQFGEAQDRQVEINNAFDDYASSEGGGMYSASEITDMQTKLAEDYGFYNKKLAGMKPHMEDQEFQTYIYFYENFGKEKADEYLYTIEDSINQREGEKTADQWDDNWFTKTLFGLGAGLTNWGEGMDSFFKSFTDNGDNTYVPYSSMDYASGMVRESYETDFGKGVYDVMNSTGNMLPSIAVSFIPYVGTGLSLASTFASSGGNAYEEMRRAGYDVNQARVYGALVGGSEAGLQYVLGGISKLGGKAVGNITGKAIAGIDNAFARFAIQWGGSMVSEGFEEGLQTVLEPFFKSLATGADFEAPDFADVAYSALLGAVTAGFMEGGSLAINTGVSNINAKKTLGKDQQSLVDTGLSLAEGTQANKLATKYKAKLDSGKNLTGQQLNLLYEANQEGIIAEDKGKIQKAVENRLKELGEKGNVSEIAEIVAKQTAGEKISLYEKAVLKNNANANKVITELNYSKESVANKGNDVGYKLSDNSKNLFTPKEKTSFNKDAFVNTYEEIETYHDNVAKILNKPTTKGQALDFVKGKTTHNGEEVTVQGVTEIKDGKVTVKLNNGKEVNVRDVKFTSREEQSVYEAVANMSVDTANEFIDGFYSQKLRGQVEGEMLTLDAYSKAFKDALKYGQYGFPDTDLNNGEFTSLLSENQRKIAYNRGKIDGITSKRSTESLTEKTQGVNQAVNQTVNQSSTKKVAKNQHKKGKVTFNKGVRSHTNTMQKDQIKILEATAEAMGVNYNFFESTVDEKGERGANGWYNLKTKTIHIDIHAGKDANGVILFTASHELTHFIRDFSETKFKEFADFLFAKYGEMGQSVEDLIARKLPMVKEQAIKDGLTLSPEELYDLAYEEVVADACERMLTDSNAIEQLVEKFGKKDKTFLAKIKKFFVEILAKIRQIFAKIEPDSLESNLTAKMKDTEALLNKWVEALTDATENYQAWVNNKTTESKVIEGNLEARDITNVLSRRYVDEHKTDLATNYNSKESTVSLEDLTKRYDAIVKIWDKIGGELNSKFLNEWDNKIGKDRTFDVFKAQAGYKYNIELSSMCKKGVPLFEAIDTIVKDEIMQELDLKTLNKEEKEILYDILKSHNFEIPCAICYVEQARQREGVIIDAFLDGRIDKNSKGEVTKVKVGWNQVLADVQKEMAKNGVDYTFPAVSRDIATDKYVAEKYTMDEVTQTAFYNALQKLANKAIEQYNKEKAGDKKFKPVPLLKSITPNTVKASLGRNVPNLKLFKILFENPSSRFTIDRDLLYSSVTTRNLSMSHNSLYGLFNQQGGVSGYKSKQTPIVYWGDILGKKWNPSTLRKEGGIRNQSNSDFQMYTLLDQAQMYIDFTAKGFYLQAYTKVLAELKLFGLSKGKINASLIPKVHVYYDSNGQVDVAKTMENAGLDENGNPIYDDFEGINHTEAFMLIEDKEYSKNITGICIGYSDNHIFKLLDDPRVQLIIGFHDKTDDGEKRYRGARYAKNYNGLNEAYDIAEDKTKHIGFNQFVKNAESMFKYNSKTETYEGTVDHNGKTYEADDIPMLAGDLYLEHCEKKGYRPAYNDFKGHPNYYKLLADFGLKDSEGHYAPHQKVAYNMPTEVPYLDANGNKQYMKTEDYIKAELEKELAVRDSLAEDLADKSEDGIISQFKKAYTDPNYRKELTKKANEPTVLRSSRDSSYMDAVNRGDMETAQRMVDEAAREAGYTTKAFHGTHNFGRTVFNKYDVLFLTDREYVAKGFSNGTGKRTISRGEVDAFADDIGKVLDYINHNSPYSDVRLLSETDIDKLIKQWTLTDKDIREFKLSKEDVSRSKARIDRLLEVKRGIQSGETYYIGTNIHDSNFPTNSNIASEETIRGIASNTILRKGQNAGVYEMHANIGKTVIVEGNGNYYANLSVPNELRRYARESEKSGATTDQIVRMAHEAGYNSVTFKNIREGGDYGNAGLSTVYAVFNPTENVKSADTVTYDDNGNVIPLSERFNSENNDIRYSNRDSEGNTLTAEQQEFFKDSKIRDENGNLLVLYHGTKAEFTTFDRDFIGSTGAFEGAGFNFTPSESRAKSYGGNVLEVYLNVKNPLSNDKKTITARQLADIIRTIDPTGDNIIANYAQETRDYGTSSFIRRESMVTARQIVNFCDNDVDIYSELSAASSERHLIVQAFADIGYDGVIHYYDNGKIKTVITFDSNQSKLTSNKTPTSNPDIRYSDRVSNKELAEMDDTALYIKNTKKANYIGMIFNGTKTEETRSTRTLDAFIGKDFYVTDGKYVYGSIVMGEPHRYTEEEFHKLENQKRHRVPKGDEYDIKKGGIKWAYPIESYTKFDKPKKLSNSKEYKNSFQAREILYDNANTVVNEGQVLYQSREYSKPITFEDVEGLRSIGVKSINEFTPEDIEKAKKWAYKFYNNLGTKSPFFRAWFGDWRAYDKNSIKVIDATRHEGKNPRGKFRNRDTDWEINSSSVGYDETVSHSGKNKKSIIAMQNIDTIIENAILLDTEVSEYGRGKKSIYTAFMHKFYALCRIDGKLYLAKMTVDESYNPNQADTNKKFYHVRAIKIETASSVGIGKSHTPIIEDTVSTIRIADLVELVKWQDDKFNPKFVNPLLLNEDGTPKPFYHGTNKEFSIFDAERTSRTVKRYVEGFYFSAEKRVAEKWSRNRTKEQGGNPNVMAVYLDVKNPLIMTDMDYKKLGFDDKHRENVLRRLITNKHDGIIVHPEKERILGVFDDSYNYEIDDNVYVNADKYGITDKDYAWWLAHSVGNPDFTAMQVAVFNPNQIKSASDNIGTFNKAEEDILYQYRDTSMSTRNLLANALESTAQNDIERQKLAQYKEKIDLINSEEQKLKELKGKIKDLSFAKGKRDTEQINKLQFEANQTANRINTYDKQLLNLEASKPLKDVLQREKQLAYKRAEQRGKEALAEYKEKSNKTIRELMDRAKESRRKGVERRTMTELRGDIKKVVSELNQLLLHGTKERNIKFGLQEAVADALEAINLDTVDAENRIAKLQQDLMNAKTPEEIEKIQHSIDFIRNQGDNFADKLEKLRKAYSEIRNNANKDFPSQFKEEAQLIHDRIEMVIQDVGDTPLRNMTLAQLQEVYDMYKMVLTTIRLANNIWREGKLVDLQQNASTIMQELESIKPLKAEELAVKSKVREFSWNEMTPYYAFQRIGSDTYAQYYQDIVEGQNTYARDIDEANNFATETRKKYGYNKWKLDKVYEFKLKDGRTFQTTLKHVLSIYAYSKREQALAHMREGGFFHNDKSTFRKKGGVLEFTRRDEIGYKIDEEILEEIKNSLTKEQIGYVDEMQDYLTKMGEKGNEVTRVMWGIDIFKEKVYFPLKSKDDFIKRSTETAQNVSLKNDGMTKETKPNASNPIVLEAFDDVWASHVERMSQYHAFVIPIDNINKVSQYGTWAGTDSMAVSTMITARHGSEAKEYIEQFIKDLNGGVTNQGARNPFESFFGKFKKTAVGMSLSTIVQQPTAILRAFAIVDAKYFVGKPDMRTLGKKWSEIKIYAPIAIIKEIGGFDAGGGRQASNWLNKDTLKGKDKVMDTIDDISMKGAELADKMGWVTIWEAVKREVKANNPTMDVNSEAFLEKCGKRFTEVIVQTQVYDSTLSRSGYMRSKNSLVKMATAFMGEPTLSFNMVANAVIQAKRGGKGAKAKAVRVIASVYLAQIAATVASSFIYALRDDDEDESYWEKYMQAFGGEFISDIVLAPVTSLPFIKDIVSIFQGWDVERSDMSIIKDIKDAFDGLDSGNKSTYRKIEDLAGAIASIFGVPLKNLLRTGRETYNFFENIFDGIEGGDMGDAFVEGITGDEKTKAEKLYEAIINGDKARLEVYKKQYKDEDALISALRGEIKDRFLSEEIDSDTAEQYLIEHCGMSENDAYWKMKEWESELINGDSEDYSKYNSFYTAVESGKNLKAVIKEYTDNGVSKQTLASQITSHFKPLYKEMSRRERANIKGYLLNAYALLGYNRAEKSKDIDNWLKD